MPFKSEKQRKWMHTNDPEMAKKWEKKEKKMKRVRELIKKMVREELAELDEAAKRDYKAEYKKFQSSTKSKKYRAELNAYNRKKGTYGNGDGKDASHKGGKIAGFEKESVNRGRREKSRLKKEEKLNEFNKSHFLNLIKQQIESLKGRITYCKDRVRDKDLENWERKEYAAVLKDNIKDLKDTEKHYKRVEKLSEGKLSEKQSAAVQRMAKQGMWVVTDGGRETIKVVKNERAAKMLVKKLKKDKSNRYHNPQADPIKLEGKLSEAKETIFDVAYRVMKDKQAQNYKSKKGMVKVDMQTANLLVKVFKKVNPKMKQILSKLGYDNPAGLMKTLWAVVK